MDSTELQKLLTSQDVEVDHKVQEVLIFFSNWRDNSDILINKNLGNYNISS